jgi:hypothetical protein
MSVLEAQSRHLLDIRPGFSAQIFPLMDDWVFQGLYLFSSFQSHDHLIHVHKDLLIKP